MAESGLPVASKEPLTFFDDVKDAILQEYGGTLAHGLSVDQLVHWVESLPPMPEVARRAMQLAGDPNVNVREIATVLADDPAFASAVLRLANAAALGHSRAVVLLEEAVFVIGLGALRNLIMTVTLRAWNRKFQAMDQLVWEKSIGTAAAADVLATYLAKRNRDELRLVGLLHNLGQLAFLIYPQTREQYATVLERVRTTGEDYATAERAVIGATHALVGSLVAHNWGFSQVTSQTILRHADPFDGVGTKLDQQVALLRLASELSYAAGIGVPRGYAIDIKQAGDLAVAVGFKLDIFAEDGEALLRQIRNRFQVDTSTYPHFAKSA